MSIGIVALWISTLNDGVNAMMGDMAIKPFLQWVKTSGQPMSLELPYVTKKCHWIYVKPGWVAIITGK